MAGQYGTKETKELFDACPKFAKAVFEAFKDGAQLSDAIKIGAATLEPTFQAAIDNATDIPKELGELDIEEVREVGHAGWDSAIDTILVFRTEAPKA